MLVQPLVRCFTLALVHHLHDLLRQVVDLWLQMQLFEPLGEDFLLDFLRVDALVLSVLLLVPNELLQVSRTQVQVGVALRSKGAAFQGTVFLLLQLGVDFVLLLLLVFLFSLLEVLVAELAIIL